MAVPLAWNLVAGPYAKRIRAAFEPYSRRALELAGTRPQQHILDVATGPGTLAVLAAQAGHRVTAVDFSSEMLAELRARLDGTLPITVEQADGMALPFPDATFDAAFSMFGLMFFPDRAQGFRELHRVLRPGSLAVISSWRPMAEVPMMAAVFAAQREILALPPSPPIEPVLANEAACVEEMSCAGFSRVSVERCTQAFEDSTLAQFWSWFPGSCAPLALAREELGTDSERVEQEIFARLLAQYGDGPVKVEMTALLTRGTCP